MRQMMKGVNDMKKSFGKFGGGAGSLLGMKKMMNQLQKGRRF